MWAARNGHAAVCTTLVEKGAAVDLADNEVLGRGTGGWATCVSRLTVGLVLFLLLSCLVVCCSATSAEWPYCSDVLFLLLSSLLPRRVLLFHFRRKAILL